MLSAPPSSTLATDPLIVMRQRIEARITKQRHGGGDAASPNERLVPFAKSAARAVVPAPVRPPKTRRQTDYRSSPPLPHVELLDLTDDLLVLIVLQLGVERNASGLRTPHPSTLPAGPYEKDALPPDNSMDVASGDTNYIGYGGVWLCTLACTSSRFAAATKETPASPWCAKMDRPLARKRALHAMRQLSFVSPTLVIAWVVDLLPLLLPLLSHEEGAEEALVESQATWCEEAEDAVALSVLRNARKGKIGHERIAAYARIIITTFYQNQRRPTPAWPKGEYGPYDRRRTQRLVCFQETPSGGAAVLTCMEEVCVAGRRLRIDPVVVCMILKRTQDTLLMGSYADTDKYMKVPEGGAVAPSPRSPLEHVMRRTELLKGVIPALARNRLRWRHEIFDGIATVGRLNGYLE